MISVRVRFGVMTVLISALNLLGSLPAAHADPSPWCQHASVPVASGLLPTEMHGELCLPSGGDASTVMVLVPGATYNHTYWNFPYQEPTYNFRRAMNQAGYATFVVDRLGTGESSRPPSASATVNVQAAAVHHVVQALRSGAIADIAFSKVILGSHSLGSVIAISEASVYQDVDAVLLTGLTHSPNSAGQSALMTTLYPATLDPAFAGQGYDPGYLTTQPGTRGIFYAPGLVDPNIVALDEATKDVVSVGEVSDAFPPTVGPSTLLIQEPVLLVMGELDPFFCGTQASDCSTSASLYAGESQHFSPAACLQTYVLEDAGHNINLFANAPDYQDVVLDWADAFVGAGPDPVTPVCH